MATLTDFGYGSMKLDGVNPIGTRPLLIILSDIVNVPFAHPKEYYEQMIFGPAAKTINDYYKENSDGRFSFTKAGIIKIKEPRDLSVPRSLNERLGKIKLLAIESGFDFTPFEKDGNNSIDNKELVILVIDNSDNEAAVRTTIPVSPPVNASGLRLSTHMAIVGHNVPFLMLAHELCHCLDAKDLYFGNNNLGNYGSTLMGGSPSNNHTWHLDPWHKMSLRWLEPDMYDLQHGNTMFTLHVPSLNNPLGPVIVYNSDRGLNEYFILEFRSRFTTEITPYDDNVPDTGLVIWRVVPDGTPDIVKTFTLGAPSFEKGGTSYWRGGTTTPTLQWQDGSSAFFKVHVRPFEFTADTIMVDLIMESVPEYLSQKTPYIRWMIENIIGVDIYGNIIVHPPKPETKDMLTQLFIYELAETMQEESKRNIQKTILHNLQKSAEQKLKDFEE